MQNILIAGDIHGEYGIFNSFIAKKQPKIIYQCGDLGYYPNVQYKKTDCLGRQKYLKKLKIKSSNTKVFFCDGNHEDHWSLKALTNNEIFPNIFYMPRGSLIKLDDGRNVLFMGGANSVDKAYRMIGKDWFPEENITWNDINKIPKNEKIDIVISHTCPKEFNIYKRMSFSNPFGLDYMQDSNRDALSYILNTYKPSLWYFGHWHQFATDFQNECRWIALDHISSGGKWFIELQNKP